MFNDHLSIFFWELLFMSSPYCYFSISINNLLYEFLTILYICRIAIRNMILPSIYSNILFPKWLDSKSHMLIQILIHMLILEPVLTIIPFSLLPTKLWPIGSKFFVLFFDWTIVISPQSFYFEKFQSNREIARTV